MSEAAGRTVRSYRPGAWFAILGERTSVLLPPGERARVPALWQLLDDGAGFDEALDALIAVGLRALPGFVLLGEDDGAVRVVVRGPARVRLSGAEGEVVLAGSAATTWVERTVPGVTRLTVEVSVEVSGEGSDEVAGDAAGTAEGSADGPVDALRIDGGLVRVSRLDQPPAGAQAEEPAGEHAEEPDEEHAGEPAEAPAAEPASVEDPGVPPGPYPPYPFATPPAPPTAPPAYDDAETQAISAADLPDQRPAEPDRPDRSDPVDEEDRRATERLAQDAPRPVARLHFSTGERVDVDRVVLVGRAPEARRFAAGEEPRLVAVESPHQEISSTHLEVRPGTGPDAGSAVLTDLGSTNGTWLLQPGGDAEELRAGLAERLRPGAVIDLGDGVTIRVLAD